jgi:eukaryotic-like serine/threonine-protein kinase
MTQPSWIGRSLNGRYQIEALLGQGGMSAVYKATDPNLKRTVAVKLIHAHLSTDPHFIQRFEEEATAVASLRHPNIVQVYDFSSDDGTYYMVLEFVAGETLQQRLKQLNNQGRKLGLEDAIKYTLNICDALAYAHQRGIIHRDIKPANIMLDIYGQAILMDFGIVKILGGTSHTATGAVLGTARYISPEVIRAEQVDQRSDIYSLGATMYEMLSGQTPFQSDSSMSLMMMHLNDPVPDPRKLRSDLPVAIVNILLKTLEKDRNKRYQTVTDLATDLRRVLSMLKNDKALPETLMAPKGQVRPQPVVMAATPSQPAKTVLAARQAYRAPIIAQPSPAPKKTTIWVWVLGLGAVFLFFMFVVVIAGVYMFSGQIDFSQATPTLPMVAAMPMPGATQNSGPAPTFPPYSAHIKSITIVDGRYSVDYETTGFVPDLNSFHVHFFFNDVAPEDAGMPGPGPWKMYGGPIPFTGYTVSQRPEGVSKMCVLVASAEHVVIPNSGNCVNLP